MTSLMQGLIQLSEHPLVYALGWTLLHFCWQGTAVALMLGCVLGLLGGRSSQARYAAACLALGLMVALPAATFAHIASAEHKARTVILGPGVMLDSSIVLDVGANEPIPPWPARIGMALDRSLPWVLLAWFAGMIVFVGRLNFGLLVARRLKTTGTEAPPPALLQLFEALRIRLRVDRAVQLLHSTQVQVPTVIGWLRPVVLLPVSCLTGLSPDQIEAVLCHELAHVRRHDYLVSVIQSVIETVLFYHPAVWWVSKQVRRERECCCDELAVAVGGDVLAYARALSFLEENRASFPEFVLGANGGVLKMRIQRILGSKRDAEGSPAAALVALGLILALAGSYFAAVSHAQAQSKAQTQTQPDTQAQSPPQLPPTEIARAALPAGIVSVSQEGTANPNAPATPPLHGVYKTWLEQDVRWIVTDPEAQAFKQLTSDEERDAFIKGFWERRNPSGSAEGTYRQDHYARIAYSNEHFAAGKPGWMTDRGHIYIVYGKPESIDSHPTGGSVTAYPYDIWHYKYIAGIGDNVDLAFVDTCKCGDYHYTIDPAEKYVDRSYTGPGLVKQESAQLDAIDAQISLAKKIFAPPAIGDKEKDAAPRATAAQEAGSISGKIVDPTGALVPGAKVTATNTDDGVQTSRVTDNAGTYSISPLRPGPYNVEVQAKGFQRMLQENVNVKPGQTFVLNLKLTVGGAAQSFTVTGKPIIATLPPQPLATDVKPTGPQRVSSGVMQGLIISQPQPVYPDEAKAQHIQGVVVLHARISKEGAIKDLDVLSGPPALIVSAIDAVRQWKYKPYLIDGEPTEVETTINVNYTLGQPEMSCTYYNAGVGHAGTCEEGITDKGHYYCRADDDKGLVQSQTGCEWKVKRLQDWLHDTQSPASIQTTPSPASRLGPSTGDAPIADTVAPAQTAPHQQYDGVPVRRIGGGVKAPELIYKIDPEFSAEAKKAKFNGIVLVNFIVDAKGKPQNVHVLRGVGMGLDEKALKAVRAYKFKPATELGKPVPVGLNVEVNFQIF